MNHELIDLQYDDLYCTYDSGITYQCHRREHLLLRNVLFRKMNLAKTCFQSSQMVFKLNHCKLGFEMLAENISVCNQCDMRIQHSVNYMPILCRVVFIGCIVNRISCFGMGPLCQKNFFTNLSELKLKSDKTHLLCLRKVKSFFFF